jgi:hypothetical protein
MPIKTQDDAARIRNIVLVIAVLAVIGGLVYWLGPFAKQKDHAAAPKAPAAAPQTSKQIPQKTVHDYNQMDQDSDQQEVMQKRKDQYGVDKGIDMLVTSDEAVKIGETTVDMQKVAEKINLQEGKIIEKEIGAPAAAESEKGDVYGIYVVQPNDNLWNIHFRFLKSYYAKRDIELSPKADEPNNQGYSSGVGKLLKFSENMVHIYNIKDQRLTSDLHTIEPLTKIVIYQMQEVFDILNSIDYSNVQQIQFDGSTLWVPAEQP